MQNIPEIRDTPVQQMRDWMNMALRHVPESMATCGVEIQARLKEFDAYLEADRRTQLKRFLHLEARVKKARQEGRDLTWDRAEAAALMRAMKRG